METQKCYIYAPDPKPDTPARKKRKLEHKLENSSWPLRERIYRELWTAQERKIETVIENANRTTIDNITSFIRSPSPSPAAKGKIPTALVIAGPGLASYIPFFNRLADAVTAPGDGGGGVFVLLSSAECPNLKTALKVLIRRAVQGQEGEEEGEEVTVGRGRSRRKYLDFDLGILEEWVREREGKVFVAVGDSEGFEGGLVGELVEILSSWMDRIPFVLLFGIATSVESFQERLTGATIKRLHGEKFDVIQADELFEQVFKSTIECGDDEWVLRIGSTLAGRLLDRQKDHILSVEAFIDALKYAYMSHFFANPLSILLRTAHLEQQDASKQEEPYFKDIPKDHFEALRNLPSFRRHIEEGAFGEYGDESLLELLDDDSALFTYAQKKMHNAQYQMKEIIRGIDILFAIRSCMPKLPHVPRSALYVKAAAGELRDSPLFRELMLSLRRIPSDVLERVLSTLHKMDFKHEDLSVYMGRLHARLVAMMERSQHPLRSEHNLRNETLRTTVVAQKVELSVQKGALSKEDREYSLLLDDFLDRMKRRIGDVFIDPRNLFLHEVFLYDLKSPHGEVFTPRPRFAIERALSSPHDYLGCSCCAPARGRKGEGDEQALSVTQPPTAILYQLYLESGPLINVSDLWSAFNAIVSSADDDEAFVMAMFQRGLAELKYLGMIKASRKKTDHVAKLAWKGL